MNHHSITVAQKTFHQSFDIKALLKSFNIFYGRQMHASSKYDTPLTKIMANDLVHALSSFLVKVLYFFF